MTFALGAHHDLQPRVQIRVREINPFLVLRRHDKQPDRHVGITALDLRKPFVGLDDLQCEIDMHPARHRLPHVDAEARSRVGVRQHEGCDWSGNDTKRRIRWRSSGRGVDKWYGELQRQQQGTDNAAHGRDGSGVTRLAARVRGTERG